MVNFKKYCAFTCATKPNIPARSDRLSQSILVETTTGVLVAIILKSNILDHFVRPKFNGDEQAYPTIDTMVDINEKNVWECKGCARFPMARIVVTSEKKSFG